MPLRPKQGWTETRVKTKNIALQIKKLLHRYLCVRMRYTLHAVRKFLRKTNFPSTYPWTKWKHVWMVSYNVLGCTLTKVAYCETNCTQCQARLQSLDQFFHWRIHPVDAFPIPRGSSFSHHTLCKPSSDLGEGQKSMMRRKDEKNSKSRHGQGLSKILHLTFHQFSIPWVVISRSSPLVWSHFEETVVDSQYESK